MSWARKDLGQKTDIAAVDALLPVGGLHVVDAGCGAGKASRELASRGATVLGVEPDPVQAVKNAAADPFPGLTFIEARAEKLPVDDGVMDAVFFFRSLHHVPSGHMDGALREAARVLKPATGVLYVVEPSMAGSHFAVVRPFHDETAVRNAAQAALERTARSLFVTERHYQYVQYPRYESFEAFAAHATGQTFNTIRREDVDRDDVRALFEANRSPEGDYVFEQPMLVNFYRTVRQS